MYKTLWVILLAILACKEEDIKPSILELYGIYDFKVEGVPSENIEPLGGHGVMVNLPANYKGGQKLKVSFRHSKKGSIDKAFNEDGWVNGSAIYEGNILNIKDMGVVVRPFKDVEILPTGKPYRLPLVGKETRLNFFVRNWGTDLSPADSVWLAQLIQKSTGTVISVTISSSIPAKEGAPTPVSVEIPRDMNVGEYKVMLFHRNKPLQLPDPLLMEYGPPEAGIDFWPQILLDTARIAGVWGYNLLPDHKYEMILSNDFFKPRRFLLTSKDTRHANVVVPPDVPNGNYVREILMDGKTLPLHNLINSDNLLIVQKEYAQPRLMSLTHISQLYYTDFGLAVFKPLTHFKRGQEILAITATPDARFWVGEKLILKNVDTHKEFILNSDEPNGFFPNIVFSSVYFLIPTECPPGRYAVTFSCSPDGVTTYYSERYHRIITIE